MSEAEKVDSPGVAIAPAASRNQILVLDQTLKAARNEIAEAAAAGNEILKALTLAKATQRLRQLLTPELMGDVMALMNTPLGFRTDKDPSRGDKPYPVEVVRDVTITAMVDGSRLVGNEFNIISGNYYRTLEQFERRIRDYPGLTDFRMQIGVPVVQGESALADMRATWRLGGKPGQLACCKTADSDTRIPIRVNKGMGLDAILGKARRKFLARVIDYLEGTSFELDDAAIEAAATPLLTVDPPAAYSSKPVPARADAEAESGEIEHVAESPTTPDFRNRPTAAAVATLLADVEGTLLTAELVGDAQRAGSGFLDRITSGAAAGQWTDGEAESLRKVVAGLVESRVKEIKESRGEKSNRK